MALTKVTLTGTFIDGEGRPLCGSVQFVPSAPLVDTTDELLMRQFGCSVTLSEEGTFSVELISTDNTNLLPSGWCWLIKECFPGIAPNLWAFFLAYGSGSTQALSSLEPVAVAPVTGLYLPLSGGTMTGALVLDGNPTAALQSAPRQYVDAETTRAEGAEAALGAQIADCTVLLVQTAVQAGNYTAAANQLVPTNTSGGSLTVSLPNAPAAGTIVSVKQIATSGSFATTVATQGSDVLNKAGGSTTMTLPLLNQGILLQYDAGIWLVLADDLPLSQLDSRYLQAANTVTIAQGGTGQMSALAGYDALSPMTTLGDTVFQSGSGSAARLAGSTSATKRFFTQTGTGTVSATPAWAQIAAGDVPGVDGVTVSGTPAEGEALIATSTTAATWTGVFGTRPEWFGTISGTSGDEVAINAAIQAVKNGAAGCPGPVVISQPCAVSNPVAAATGVNLAGTGQGNRQVGPPDTFAGGCIFPSTSFPAGTALIEIGVTNTGTQYQTNPNGICLFGLCLSGYCIGNSSYTAQCTGVLVTDTTDVHLDQCFIANMDRADGVTGGYCVYATSASAGDGYGLEVTNSVLSTSAYGIYMTGAGVTDSRIRANLLHSNTYGMTVGGSNLGGGGGQLSGNHYTYSGQPSGGYHLLMGSQAGGSVVNGEYFDNGGTASIVVQLVTAKIVMSNNTFLANSGCTATSLVKLETASQEIVFNSNSLNANSSDLVSLLQTSAHAGTPTGGVFANNVAFGTTGDFVGVLIDSASAAITATTTGAVSISGNVVSA